MAQVRRAVSTPIAADESCTTVRSALELIKADACDVFVVYPSEAGGLTRAAQIGALAAAAGKWCAIGSWAELGVATTANAHLVVGIAELPLRQRHALPAPAGRRPRRAGRDRGRRDHRVPAEPGLGVTLDPEPVATLSALELRESPFYDDIRGDAPRVGQIL